MATADHTQGAVAPDLSPIDRHVPPAGPAARGSGKAGRAILLGVLGIVTGLLIPLAGWALGAFAIHASRKADSGGRATLGLVLGVLAVLAGFLSLAVTLGTMS
jgi:hypothetical protein